MSTLLGRQYELLRLVVQKMEIHTEDESRDEGENFDLMHVDKQSRWAPAKHNILRQKAIVAHWKQSMTDD